MAIIFACLPRSGTDTAVSIPLGMGRFAKADGKEPSSRAATGYALFLNCEGSGASSASWRETVAGGFNKRENGDDCRTMVLRTPGTAMVSRVPANSLRIQSRTLTTGCGDVGMNTG